MSKNFNPFSENLTSEHQDGIQFLDAEYRLPSHCILAILLIFAIYTLAF